MSTIHVTRRSPAPPGAVWEVLTDFAGHGRWIPLTSMRLDAGPPRVGWAFTGVTGVGRLAFSDSMVLTRWVPPSRGEPEGPDGDEERGGELRLVKTGWLLGGWAHISVLPDGSGSRVVWHEVLTIRPLPAKRLTAGLLRAAGQRLYGRALDGMLAAAQSRSASASRRAQP